MVENSCLMLFPHGNLCAEIKKYQKKVFQFVKENYPEITVHLQYCESSFLDNSRELNQIKENFENSGQEILCQGPFQKNGWIYLKLNHQFVNEIEQTEFSKAGLSNCINILKIDARDDILSEIEKKLKSELEFQESKMRVFQLAQVDIENSGFEYIMMEIDKKVWVKIK